MSIVIVNLVMMKKTNNYVIILHNTKQHLYSTITKQGMYITCLPPTAQLIYTYLFKTHHTYQEIYCNVCTFRKYFAHWKMLKNLLYRLCMYIRVNYDFSCFYDIAFTRFGNKNGKKLVRLPFFQI